jgi:hypothetical protein
MKQTLNYLLASGKSENYMLGMAGFARTSCVRMARNSYTDIRLGNLKRGSLEVCALDWKKYILNAGLNDSIWDSNDCRDELEDSGR